MFRQGMSFLYVFFLAPLAVGQTTAIPPPEAKVTFYSTGSFWKATEPGYKHGVFSGLIFDDKQPLAQMKGGHFVTFTFLPGEHVFSANYWFDKSTKGGAHLKVSLAPGQHYYIATYFNARSLLIASLPLVEQSDCQNAQKDTVKAKPLPKGDLEEEAIPYWVVETAFPPCT